MEDCIEMEDCMWKRGSVAAFLAGMALSLGLLALLHRADALPKGFSPYRKLDTFARVLTYVENNYVEPVDDAKLIYGAIKGMVDTLDPHSTFLPPDQYRQIKMDTQGEFGGLGIEVEVRNGWLTVVAPLEGTPAHRAGLKPNDEIREIDGKSTQGMRMHEAVQAMRGPRGTRVRISVRRQGHNELLRFEIVRDIIKVISVSSKMLERGVGYVRLKNFQESTDRELERAMKEMTAKGKLRGLIFDLRGNPGGLLEQAVRVADLFIDSGLIVRTTGKGGQVMDEEHAHSKGTYLGFPMICLVNGGSASASEIVAGALQDHHRAVVLGMRTFGKGSVQTIIDLKDGSGLKLTVARYFTPSGRSIQELGIDPDIVVEERAPKTVADKIKREKDLEGHLKGTGSQPAGRSQRVLDDFQLQTAVDYLRAADVFRVQESK
jgi:carboxyl-terminal processing protease